VLINKNYPKYKKISAILLSLYSETKKNGFRSLYLLLSQKKLIKQQAQNTIGSNPDLSIFD